MAFCPVFVPFFHEIPEILHIFAQKGSFVLFLSLKFLGQRVEEIVSFWL